MNRVRPNRGARTWRRTIRGPARGFQIGTGAALRGDGWRCGRSPNPPWRFAPRGYAGGVRLRAAGRLAAGIDDGADERAAAGCFAVGVEGSGALTGSDAGETGV